VLQCLARVRQTWRLGGSLTRFMMETPIPVVPVQVQYQPGAKSDRKTANLTDPCCEILESSQLEFKFNMRKKVTRKQMIFLF